MTAGRNLNQFVSNYNIGVYVNKLTVLQSEAIASVFPVLNFL